MAESIKTESSSAKGIAAVVVVRNRAETARTTIEAILTQSRAPDALIIVANDPTPDVSDVLVSIQHEHSDTNIEVLVLEENSGAAGGFHAGLTRAVSRSEIDYVCCFDDDAVPQPGCIEALASAVERLPHVGTVGAVTQSGDGKLSWPLYLVGRTEPLTTVDQVRRACSAKGFAKAHALSWHALMVPVRVIEEIGNVEASLFHQYEDAEFGLRVRSNGLENYVVPDAECFHPPAPHSRTVTVAGRPLRITNEVPSKEYLSTRNSLVVQHRYGGARFWYGAMPLILLRGLLACRASEMPTRKALQTVLFPAVRDAATGRLGPPPTDLH